jgi:hypothetical protein
VIGKMRANRQRKLVQTPDLVRCQPLESELSLTVLRLSWEIPCLLFYVCFAIYLFCFPAEFGVGFWVAVAPCFGAYLLDRVIAFSLILSPMKRYLTPIVAVLLLSHCLLAETVGVAFRTSTDGNRYFLVFSARGNFRDRKSATGHAWAGFGVEDKASKKSTYTAFGLYPRDETKRGYKNILFGAVPGELVDETTTHSTPATTESLIVEVDKPTYDHALDSAMMTLGNPPDWQMMLSDCVTFTQTIASSIGLSFPEREMQNVMPQAYIRSVIRAATAVNTINFPDGSVYRGQTFSQTGRPNGMGTLTRPRGTVVTGQFIEGHLSEGKATFSDGSQFTGTFFPKVTGTIILRDGTSYTGEFKDGKINGQGKLQIGNGDTFEGTFKNGSAIHGTYHWKNGDSQTGDLVNSSFEGQTHFVRANGTQYDGLWTQGHAQGAGRVVSKDGQEFVGSWSNGHLQREGAKERGRDGAMHDIAVDRGGRGGGRYADNMKATADHIKDGRVVDHAEFRGMDIHAGGD